MSELKLLKEFHKWKTTHNQHGRQAFSRFIMLTFLDGLQKSSNEFIFKGGNLLWHYIDTPRETVDLDLVTMTINSHDVVKDQFEKSFKSHKEIIFSINEFVEVSKLNSLGASVKIAFKTLSGQKNQFDLDVVYAIPTDINKIKSTVSNVEFGAASIENIISDKLAASFRYKTGNTRMKDFDDLWRISKSDIQIDQIKLKSLLISKNVDSVLDTNWTSVLDPSWKRHAKNYKDLPKDMLLLINEINRWLEHIMDN